ncbi:MAG: maleylacetate reductase [Intrasporangium sp.]|uniref:maleylacetate reductase n=1 Tax=Intrasporangium sp. TaxID=1925024 RepID=UPI003F7DE38D
MSLSFEHVTLGQRVLFGHGQAGEHLAEEMARLAAGRVMVVAAESETELADRITSGLPVALRWREVRQHVPVDLVERARAAATSHSVDALVSVGGGSTTGLAKAIALTTGLPIVAVPTTYAGSEATNVWGMTEGGVKTTGVDDNVLPASVVYDSALTMSLPAGLTVASGLNALAHCVDSLWAPRADPINRAIALEGARALAHGLPRVVVDAGDVQGRDECLYGAYLAAAAFASAGSGLHHKICHVLGGAFDLPHAETHAVVLPHVLALNEPAVPEAARNLRAALGAGTPDGAAGSPGDGSATASLERLRSSLGAPTALRDFGLQEQDLPDAVERVLPVVPESNPVRVTPERLHRLLRAAWAGETPRSES